jgi:RNA polymerase sigma-70 factor, ECF subfamily
MATPGLHGSSPAATEAAERRLIARAQQGDEAAFAEIFEKYKRRVYSLCLRLTRIPADAEDLTQDVFLLLFRKISTFRGESAFSTWLHRMVANVAFMHLRKRTRPVVSLDEDASLDEPVRREVADHDLRLKGCIDRVTLERAIAELPPGYRAVYALYELQGYGHHEIAEIMNWSVGNSKSQLHKARRKLRARILSCRIRPSPNSISQEPKERKPAVRSRRAVLYAQLGRSTPLPNQVPSLV